MTTKDRNYHQEKINGQLELLDGLRDVRKEREDGKMAILQLAQIFAFCSLPYRPTEERQVSHTARLGDGSSVEVIFTAMRPGVPVAYGNDRSLLYWLVDKAIRNESSYVSWEYASEFIRDMKQRDSGRTRELLRERFQRVASTAITVVRTTQDSEEQMIVPIVKRANLPQSIYATEAARAKDGLISFPKERPTGSLGLQFDENFVRDFMAHKVPVLRSLLVATQARPQMQDCMFFLIWRSYSAGGESMIPWDRLRDQFWQADSNKARIRLRFKEAITLIRTAWPELRAEAQLGGLVIAPPRNGIQFVTGCEEPEHVKKRRTVRMLEGLAQQRSLPGVAGENASGMIAARKILDGIAARSPKRNPNGK